MEKNEATVIMPLQPYVAIKTENYRQIVNTDMGISHFYEFTVGQKDHVIDAVPDGSIDLLFNIGEKSVHTYIGGTVFNVKAWNIGNEHTCFGIRFQPGKGVLPKDIAIDMIVNQDMEIDGDLFGKNLTEQIALSNSIEERAGLFLESYKNHIQKNWVNSDRKNINDYLLKRISQTAGSINVSQLTEETGYSECYIRRIFKEFNAVSPKQFAQYIRFQKLLKILGRGEVHYEDVALECGYYDEPHMMKEFKSYMGITPQCYNKTFSNIV